MRFASTFRGESSYNTWFTSIAVRQALIHLRQLRTRPWPEPLDLLIRHEDGSEKTVVSSSLLAKTVSPLDRAMRQERRALLAGALRHLTPKARRECCRFLLDCRPDSNLPQSKSRFHSAKRQLKFFLAGVSA